jgi:predicted GH43/DUF377 family glycosyl hydrolase
MRFFLALIFAVSGFSSIKDNFEELAFDQNIVLETKRIEFEDFPDSYNPSILKIAAGNLMCFRYSPDSYSNPWVSYIGLVLLNDSFEPISKPQLISTRAKNSNIQSQSEDARLFSYRDRIFLIYNDNMEVNNTSYADRRDMHIVEIAVHQNGFSASAPLRLLHQEKIHHLWQKNWAPFEWDKKLLISYSINPHEILYANLINGSCYPCYETQAPLEWELGTLRDSSPAQLVDGEYLAFFHSGTVLSSFSSWGWDLWHYFMGAYTFSPNPPFEITRFTPLPIVGEGFYTQSNHAKRVIFPGGYIVRDPYIYVAYGKDDCEIWIAKLDKKELQKALKAVAK